MARAYIRRLFLPFLFLLLVILGGCFSSKNSTAPDSEPEADQDTDADADTVDDQLYILLHSDTETKRIHLKSAFTGRRIEFEYNGGTYIRDRYGESMTIGQLQAGELVRLSYTDKYILTEIAVATEAFDYYQVKDFQIDKENAMITVLGKNYQYNEDLIVFSEGGIISLSELSSQDTLHFRGVGSRLLTVVVVKGHGTVTLRNTDIFVGGRIAIGNVLNEEIQADMTLEVPEGTYILSVENGGYGGSREITVNRFEDLVVNLDELRGEGPKHCIMKITVTPSDASVTIDGGAVDCSQLLELPYGSYQLVVEAEGYSTWSGTLVVNSEEYALPIELDKDPDTDTE